MKNIFSDILGEIITNLMNKEYSNIKSMNNFLLNSNYKIGVILKFIFYFVIHTRVRYKYSLKFKQQNE